MFTPSRDEARRFIVDAWRKSRAGEPLSDARAHGRRRSSAMHPEYHALVDEGERHLERDYTPEGGAVNPFLHLSLHLAVAEQLAIDQPPGIRARVRAAASARAATSTTRCTRCSSASARRCGRRSASAPVPTRPSTSNASRRQT